MCKCSARYTQISYEALDDEALDELDDEELEAEELEPAEPLAAPDDLLSLRESVR